MPDVELELTKMTTSMYEKNIFSEKAPSNDEAYLKMSSQRAFFKK